MLLVSVNESSSKWRQQTERSNAFWVSLLATLALLLGRRAIKWLLYPIVAYFFLTSQEAKLRSREALQRFTGKEVTAYAVFCHLYKFALVAVDRVFLLAGKADKLTIKLHGDDVFNEYLANKQGCILIVSHVGSFDVMRVPASRDVSMPINILLDKQHNAVAMSLINSLDPGLAAQIIDVSLPPEHLALILSERLQEGRMLGIMADRSARHESTTSVDFAGAVAKLPMGPWKLASVLKVPVILCVGLLDDNDHYQVYFEKLTDGLHGSRRERMARIQQVMQHYADRLTYYVKKSPNNWFNFYSFWHDDNLTDH